MTMVFCTLRLQEVFGIKCLTVISEKKPPKFVTDFFVN